MSRVFANLKLVNEKSLQLSDSDNSAYVALKAPSSVVADYTLTLPDNSGTNGYLIQTNGSGTLSWTSGGNQSVDNFSSNSTLDSSHFVARVTSVPLTITIPSSSSNSGQQYVVVKSSASAGAVTVDASGSDTIDGTDTSHLLVNQHDKVRFVSDGNGVWYLG